MRLILTILAVYAAGTASVQQAAAQPKAPARPGLTLTSSAFEDGAVIPNKYTQSDPEVMISEMVECDPVTGGMR